MLIREIILEASNDDVVSAINDLLSLMMSKDIKSLSTEKFLSALAKRGYVLSVDELVVMMDKTEYGNATTTEVTPKDSELASQTGAVDVPVDIGGIANDQAMSDIKADI